MRLWKYRNNRVIGFLLWIIILVSILFYFIGCEDRYTEKDELRSEIYAQEETILKLESEIESIGFDLQECKSEKEQLKLRIEELENENDELQSDDIYYEPAPKIKTKKTGDPKKRKINIFPK